LASIHHDQALSIDPSIHLAAVVIITGGKEQRIVLYGPGSARSRRVLYRSDTARQNVYHCVSLFVVLKEGRIITHISIFCLLSINDAPVEVLKWKMRK
jgi:hypothetical protein